MSSGDEIAEGEYPSDNYNVEDREANGHNAGLDKEASQGESQQAQGDVSSNKHQEWNSVKRKRAPSFHVESLRIPHKISSIVILFYVVSHIESILFQSSSSKSILSHIR